MREKIRVNLGDLAEGRVFDKDELIVFHSDGRMETVRQEPNSEKIMALIYGILKHKGFVVYQGRCEITPGEADYYSYRRRLEEAKLWH